MNINNITNNKQNPIIQDIKEFLRTGLMPYRLKKEINKLPPYEVRLQQEIDKLNMNNKELRLQKLLDYSNLGERFFEKNFETYQINYNNAKAFETAKRFITNFEIANKRGTGIIFYGPYGVGKTHLACSIANELLKMQKSVVFGSTIKLFGIIKKSYNNEIQENKSKIISEFINCDVLIIDDLGKEKPSEWVLEKLYYIINERYEHNKPIIITTNFTENQLIDIFTVGKNKSSIEAIMSRLNEICLTVKIFDNDYRYKI